VTSRARGIQKKVVILGWYGSNNTGDEAVLQAVVGALRQRGFDRLHVLSTAPGQTAEKFNVSSSPRTPTLESIKALQNGATLILGGGGLIQDGTSVYNLPLYALYVALARLFGLKVICWGLGVEPLWTPLGKALARFIVRSSSHFSVRDDISRSILARAGVPMEQVTVSADPAFLIEPHSDSMQEPRERPLVIFCVRHLSDNHPGINFHYLLPVSLRRRLGLGWRPPAERNERFMEGLARGIKVCTMEFGADVVLLPLWPGRDDSMLDELERVASHMEVPAQQLNRAEIPPEPSRVSAFIRGADMLVSMRLHALIFGATHAVPLLALSYAHKVRGLMRLLGMERWVVEVETRTPPIEELETKLRVLWKLRAEEAARLGELAVAARATAEADADNIAALLDS
jgi:polysaccharide pyruvyl transferase CsaB